MPLRGVVSYFRPHRSNILENIMNLYNSIRQANSIKPKFGEPCNQCGWCCLTEVCPIGVVALSSKMIPCKLLHETDGKYECALANLCTEQLNALLNIGMGCNAKTQQEVLEELSGE